MYYMLYLRQQQEFITGRHGSLETAMLAQFGSESTEHFRVIMTALTGAGVSCIVVGMAVFVIVRSGVLIKRNTEDGK